MQHFVSKYGAASSAAGIKYYILDNEPSLWYSTHRDVHPSPAAYQRDVQQDRGVRHRHPRRRSNGEDRRI